MPPHPHLLMEHTMLKYCFRFVIASALLVSAFAMQNSDGWTRFTPPDKSFSALLPSKLNPPIHQVKDVPIGKKKNASGVETDEMGQIVTDMFIGETPTGLYLVGVTLYPVDITVDRELDLDRDNFLKAVGGKLVSETPVTLNGFSGKEFTGATADYTFKSRVYADRRHAYQIAARELTNTLDLKRVDNFLKSFDLNVKPL